MTTNKKKELLFSLNKNDFIVETFRAGGPGGQNQNKRNTGVRIKHPESGAVSESREYRTQEENKKTAFVKLTKTKEFKKWHHIRTSYALQKIEDYKKAIEKEIETSMNPENLKIEYYNPKE